MSWHTTTPSICCSHGCRFTFRHRYTWICSNRFSNTGVPWLIATAVDLIIGGWGVDWLIERGWDPGATRKWVLATGMFFGLGIFGAACTESPAFALFWITVALSGLSAHAPVVWSAPSLIAPRKNVANRGRHRELYRSACCDQRSNRYGVFELLYGVYRCGRIAVRWDLVVCVFCWVG